MNVAFTFAGLQALGLPDDVLASFPAAFRDGMAARAEHARRPRAERARDTGSRFGTARHVLVTVYAVDAEHLRAALAAILGADSEHGRRARAPPARRGAGRRPRPLRLLRRHRAARARRRRRRAAARRRPARRRGRLARRRDGRGPARLRRRGRDAAGGAGRAVRAQRDVRRLPQARDGRRRVPPLHRRAGRALPGRAATSSRRRSSAAGPTARRSPLSPERPDAAISSRPGADQRLRLRGRPRRPDAARSAPTSAAPTRATREGFFDGRLSNRHRIIRRGRAYGTPLPRRRARGRRRRPRPGLHLLPGRHLAPVRDRSRRSGSTTATRSASAATRTSWSASRTAPRAR